MSQASAAVLDTLNAPVTVTAYLPPRHPWRSQIEHLVSRYRRYSDDVTLELVDPASAPDKVRDEQIREGELLVTSVSRTERTGEYTEQALTETLARLARGAERFVVFVSGHGERSPTRKANHDVSDWAGVLERRGFNVHALNLAEYQVPENTAVLVIASPQLGLHRDRNRDDRGVCRRWRQRAVARRAGPAGTTLRARAYARIRTDSRYRRRSDRARARHRQPRVRPHHALRQTFCAREFRVHERPVSRQRSARAGAGRLGQRAPDPVERPGLE